MDRRRGLAKKLYNQRDDIQSGPLGSNVSAAEARHTTISQRPPYSPIPDFAWDTALLVFTTKMHTALSQH